eukprot:5711299-Pyramimonas_sp.AAC.1
MGRRKGEQQQHLRTLRGRRTHQFLHKRPLATFCLKGSTRTSIPSQETSCDLVPLENSTSFSAGEIRDHWRVGRGNIPGSGTNGV